MTNKPQVSIDFGSEVIANLQTNLQSIETVLGPNVVGLSTRQRRRLAKMNDRSRPFVDKARVYMASNPEFAPAYLGTTTFSEDLEALKSLTTIKNQMVKLTRNLEDTVMTVGAQAYLKSRAYYESVKRAANEGVPHAKPIYDDMKQRFEGQGRTAQASTSARAALPEGPPGDDA